MRLLYHEAKENVVDARYPISQSDCDFLAGLQALLKHRTFNEDEHTEEYYRYNSATYNSGLHKFLYLSESLSEITTLRTTVNANGRSWAEE